LGEIDREGGEVPCRPGSCRLLDGSMVARSAPATVPFAECVGVSLKDFLLTRRWERERERVKLMAATFLGVDFGGAAADEGHDRWQIG